MFFFVYRNFDDNSTDLTSSMKTLLASPKTEESSTSSNEKQSNKIKQNCYIFNSQPTPSESVNEEDTSWYPVFESNDIKSCEPHLSRFWNEVIFDSIDHKKFGMLKRVEKLKKKFGYKNSTLSRLWYNNFGTVLEHTFLTDRP